jgi:CRISPR system Cascade subunit CasE
MYLSRISLNIKRRETMRALASPQLMHGAVERSFEGDRLRNLWRIDWLGDVCYLLVLSAKQPDFTHIADQFGYLDEAWETKNYDTLLARLKVGESWRFRLRANPIRSSFKEKDETTGRGKVFAHVTQEQQRKWLIMRANTCGFKLEENEFDVMHTEWKKFYKGQNSKHNIMIRSRAGKSLRVWSFDDCTLKEGVWDG